MLTSERLAANRARTLLPGENNVEFDLFSGFYENLLHPSTPTQAIFTDDLVAAAWDLRRIEKVQTLASIPIDSTRFASFTRAKRKLYRTNWNAVRQLKNLSPSSPPPLPDSRKLL